MQLRRSFQRSLRALFEHTGEPVTFRDLGDTLLPIVIMADARNLAAPRFENYFGLHLDRNPAVVNRAVLAYQAPAGGAIVQAVYSGDSTDLTAQVFAEDALPVITALGVLTTIPFWGARRGAVQNGDSADAAIGIGLRLQGAIYHREVWPLQEGRWFALSTVGLDTTMNAGFSVQEFQGFGTA